MKKLLCVENILILFLVAAIIFEIYDTFSIDSKTTLYSNAVSPNVVLSGSDDLTLPTEAELVQGLNNKERFNYYINNTKLIAHAGGGIDKKSYSNSKESMETAYQNGYRIFEVDIYMTKDKQFVLTHDATVGAVTYEEFMTSKILGLYTPMDLADLVEFLKTHPYAYIIPDIKQYNDKELLLNVYTELFEYCGGNKNVSNRIIGTFKRTDMLDYVSETIKFDITILYYRNTAKQEKIIDDYKKLANYLKVNKIDCVVFSYLQYNVALQEALKNTASNIILYTLDNQMLIEQYYHRGADAIMTNFIIPKKEEII